MNHTLQELFPDSHELLEMALNPHEWRDRILGWARADYPTRPKDKPIPLAAPINVTNRWRNMLREYITRVAVRVRESAMLAVAEDAVAKDLTGDTVVVPRDPQILFWVKKPSHLLSHAGRLYLTDAHPVIRVTKQEFFFGVRYDLLPADSPIRKVQPVEYTFDPEPRHVVGEKARVVFLCGALIDHLDPSLERTKTAVTQIIAEPYASLAVAAELTSIIGEGIEKLAIAEEEKRKDEERRQADREAKEFADNLLYQKNKNDPDGAKTHAITRELQQQNVRILEMLKEMTGVLAEKGLLHKVEALEESELAEVVR